MYYPYRPDYKCPNCKVGTMKWEGMEFHSTYVLGLSYCDNPCCINSKERWSIPYKLPESEVNNGIS